MRDIFHITIYGCNKFLVTDIHLHPSLIFTGKAPSIDQHVLDTNAGKQLSLAAKDV